jgi:hypothetical protein
MVFFPLGTCGDGEKIERRKVTGTHGFADACECKAMISVLTEEEDAPGGSSHDPTRMGASSYPERNTNRSQPPSRFGSVGCQCLRCVCYYRTSVGR